MKSKSRRDYSRLIRLVVVESRVPAVNWILVSETAGLPKGEILILHHAGYLIPWVMNRVGFQSSLFGGTLPEVPELGWLDDGYQKVPKV